MFKKISSIVATLALAVTGFSMPAQAAAPATFAADSSVANIGHVSVYTLASPNVITVPAGTLQTRVDLNTSLNSVLLGTLGGATLSFDASVTDPNGAVVAAQSSLGFMAPTVPNWYGNLSSSFTGMNCMGLSVNMQTKNVTLPADPSGCSLSVGYSINVYSAPDATLVPGDYTLNLIVKSNGTVLPNSTSGLTLNASSGYIYATSNSFTSPANATNLNILANVCVDATKLVVGDTVKFGAYVDGTVTATYASPVTTAGSFTDTGYRSGGPSSASTAITAYDLTNPFSVRFYSNFMGSAPGAHVVTFKVYDDTTSTDITGTCKPEKPATPTLSFTGSSLNANVTFSKGSLANGMQRGVCALYDATAPTVVIATTSASQNGPATWGCAFTSGYTIDHSYVTAFKNSFYESFSDYSDQSAPVAVTAPGYNITSNNPGTVAAGKLVKVSDNNIPVDTSAALMNNFADGTGGFYQVAVNQPVVMGPPSVVSINVSHTTTTGYDAAFAGNTGKLTIPVSGFSFYSMPSGFGFYGSSKDKFVYSVFGFAGSGMNSSNKVSLYFGSKASSTVSTVDLDMTALSTACGAKASGYSVDSHTSTSLQPVSSTSANALFIAQCSKMYTFSDNSSFRLNVPVLVSVATDGTITALAALATPSAGENDFTVKNVSVNPGAAAGAPAATFQVQASLATKYDMYAMNMPLVESVVGQYVVRVDSAGALIGSADSFSLDAGGSFTLQQINNGTVYGFEKIAGSPPSFKLVKIATTGAPTLAALSFTGSGVTTPTSVSLPIGATPTDETLLYLTVGDVTSVVPVYLKLSD